ncbi:hypothetical protein BH24DEI2_BH24DEI2_24630 [soil metagenome]
MSLTQAYPYLQDASQSGYFGTVLFSKVPFLSSETHHLGARGHPSLEVAVTWQNRTVTIYGAHPYPPLGPRGSARRDSELAAVQDVLAEVTTPLVMMGDLNATPWSTPLRGLLRVTGLRPATLAHGIQPTWRLGSLLFGAPLDHVLVSSHWQCVGFKVGADVGSDHYPVVADLVLKKAEV